MEWNKERIKAYRKKLGLTQPRFAKLLNTSDVLIVPPKIRTLIT